MEVMEDEEPEATSLTKGDDFLFVFIVDRSGSMSGRRMEVTKDAMKLFMQSLPVGS
jgi:Mg-chelatase subunit ChlD